jgi:hypothetical protein
MFTAKNAAHPGDALRWIRVAEAHVVHNHALVAPSRIRVLAVAQPGAAAVGGDHPASAAEHDWAAAWAAITSARRLLSLAEAAAIRSQLALLTACVALHRGDPAAARAAATVVLESTEPRLPDLAAVAWQYVTEARLLLGEPAAAVATDLARVLLALQPPGTHVRWNNLFLFLCV